MYQVGDWVRVLPYDRLEETLFNDHSKTSRVYFNPAMKQYCGQIYTIKQIENGRPHHGAVSYILSKGVNNFSTLNTWVWSPEWLEIIVIDNRKVVV